MPRDHEHDDADDYRDDYHPRRRKSSGTSPALIIGLVLGGVLLLGVVVCGGLLFLMRSTAVVQGPAAQPAAANAQPAVVKGGVDPARLGGPNRAKLGGVKLVYTREEFRKLVMGKTADEVIAAVGQPDSTQETPDGTRTTWHYDNRVTNPATTKPSTGILEFKDGKVVEVRW